LKGGLQRRKKKKILEKWEKGDVGNLPQQNPGKNPQGEKTPKKNSLGGNSRKGAKTGGGREDQSRSGEGGATSRKKLPRESTSGGGKKKKRRHRKEKKLRHTGGGGIKLCNQRNQDRKRKGVSKRKKNYTGRASRGPMLPGSLPTRGGGEEKGREKSGPSENSKKNPPEDVDKNKPFGCPGLRGGAEEKIPRKRNTSL